jgi:hypothetical protein
MTDLCIKPNYLRRIWQEILRVGCMVFLSAAVIFSYQVTLPGLKEVLPNLAVGEEQIPSPILCGFVLWSVSFGIGALFLTGVIGKEWLIDSEGIGIARFGCVSRHLPWSTIASITYNSEVETLFVSTNVSKGDWVSLSLIDEKQGTLMEEIWTRYLETIPKPIKGEKPGI